MDNVDRLQMCVRGVCVGVRACSFVTMAMRAGILRLISAERLIVVVEETKTKHTKKKSLRSS